MNTPTTQGPTNPSDAETSFEVKYQILKKQVNDPKILMLAEKLFENIERRAVQTNQPLMVVADVMLATIKETRSFFAQCLTLAASTIQEGTYNNINKSSPVGAGAGSGSGHGNSSWGESGTPTPKNQRATGNINSTVL